MTVGVYDLDRAVAEFMAEFKDGDIVDHEWLQHRLSIPSVAWLLANGRSTEIEGLPLLCLKRVDAFRDVVLKDHNIHLQNVRGVGYMVVPPSAQALAAMKEMHKCVSRAMEKMTLVHRHTRTDLLDDAERRQHYAIVDKGKAVADMHRKQRRDILADFTSTKRLTED